MVRLAAPILLALAALLAAVACDGGGSSSTPEPADTAAGTPGNASSRLTPAPDLAGTPVATQAPDQFAGVDVCELAPVELVQDVVGQPVESAGGSPVVHICSYSFLSDGSPEVGVLLQVAGEAFYSAATGDEIEDVGEKANWKLSETDGTLYVLDGDTVVIVLILRWLLPDATAEELLAAATRLAEEALDNL